MFERIVVLVVAWVASAAAGAADVPELLRAADRYRLADGPMRVETQVIVLKNGTQEKERRYTVYLKPGRRSLVLFRSPAEAGQKMLMTADDYWLLMPGTGRPIRVTPQQKLLGDASTGDIATMTWHEDYAGDVAGEETVEGRACTKLDLKAQRAGVSYARIVLYLATGTQEPVRADLYVASDKLAKQAFFDIGPLEGRRQVVAMRLLDQIQKSRETVVRYLARTPKTLPDEVFNPMYLTRNDVKE